MKIASKINQFCKRFLKIDLNKYYNWFSERYFILKHIDAIEIDNYKISKSKCDISKLDIGDKPIKLHLGCGDKHLDGFINIDHRETKATDLVSDIRELPFENDSVQRIELYHVVEHLPRNIFPKALKEWHRILRKGGQLIIECPDFDSEVKEYLNGNEDRLDNIFGQQRFRGDVHYFGYNFPRMKKFLEKAGYEDIRNCDPQDYHKENEPCLRVEAVK